MTTPDQAYAEIQKLVQRFKNLSAAERKGMNENATRQGYILPLFRALGWDTDNINEVSPEEKVSRGWVDFSFRIGGVPRFFLETKRMNEDLNDPRWVKQAIDYAWTKSVTWALLSDFEGLRVFNAEWKEENPFRAQFKEFTVDTYLTNFEELWWFSRPETLAGRLNNEAEKVGKRSKREPVSQRLFDDLKQLRSSLYTSLHGYNRLYSPKQIDEAVLRILNRLIFIRTAEYREVEPNRLMALLREVQDKKEFGQMERKLSGLFRELDGVYNSELFARHFSEELTCEYQPLKELIEGLYEKNYLRYNFNAIDADVFGTVYEQYLGGMVKEESDNDQMMLIPAAHVEEKRGKRKSQGIFYTPTFVTKYIVEQTVGRYLQENGYNPSRPPRVLDMACGSGSFLIHAFETIDRYVAQQRNQLSGETANFFDRARQLEVLTNCIYGVDKDKQAVEVARLNLLLRALHSREKLPMLENIVQGDSLITGTPQELKDAFGENWKNKKAFDWADVFKNAMREGGFDLIIGNPPYVNVFNLPPEDVDYYASRYSTFKNKYDLYGFFLERAVNLLKDGGVLGFITSRTWLSIDSFSKLRQFLLESGRISQIVLMPSKTFVDATVETAIIIFQSNCLPGQQRDRLISEYITQSRKAVSALFVASRNDSL